MVALRSVALFPIILASVIGANAAFVCPNTDKKGGTLTDSSTEGTLIVCKYTVAGRCEFFGENGGFSDGSSSCPGSVGGAGGSTGATTPAAPPPAQTTAPPAAPPPAQTTAPPAAPTIPSVSIPPTLPSSIPSIPPIPPSASAIINSIASQLPTALPTSSGFQSIVNQATSDLGVATSALGNLVPTNVPGLGGGAMTTRPSAVLALLGGVLAGYALL